MAATASSMSASFKKEIVLDVQVDGVHYTLTRLPPPPAQSEVSLSPREAEIVRLVAKGLPNKTIAAVLDISPWTVATHLRRVFSKLGVKLSSGDGGPCAERGSPWKQPMMAGSPQISDDW